jgi:hypothetical protein
VSSRVPTAANSLSVPKSSDITTCPMALGTSSDREGLCSRHVSHGFRSASRCGRALASSRATRLTTRQGRATVSQRVPQFQTHLPVREGSGVATCHRARCPAGKGSGVTTCSMAPDPPSGAGGLRCRHVPRAAGPATRQGRAPTSSHVLWLQTHLPVREGSGVTTCLMALSLRGEPARSQGA